MLQTRWVSDLTVDQADVFWPVSLVQNFLAESQEVNRLLNSQQFLLFLGWQWSINVTISLVELRHFSSFHVNKVLMVKVNLVVLYCWPKSFHHFFSFWLLWNQFGHECLLFQHLHLCKMCWWCFSSLVIVKLKYTVKLKLKSVLACLNIHQSIYLIVNYCGSFVNYCGSFVETLMHVVCWMLGLPRRIRGALHRRLTCCRCMETLWRPAALNSSLTLLNMVIWLAVMLTENVDCGWIVL